ncbi:MAG: hypothetical protein KatS3mg022_0875 [Armatimonadota bacterium]|nr:MAG: hypothetical protein KatS3mg022_0875 [Armatimonadota bacterium]
MRYLLMLLILIGWGSMVLAQGYQDRWVWIFGWGLNRDDDVTQITAVLEEAAKHGYNGAVLSANLDALCKQPPEYFRRLQQVKQTCERLNLEIIPSIFSVGYGGGTLWHDRHLAEGMPVQDALFVVQGNEARHVPDPPGSIVNGGFEDFDGNRMKAFNFHDEPGMVSFPDTQVVHSGKASLRFENFRAQPAGNARVMQEVRVHPYRCYRMSVWVKTEGLRPRSNLRLLVLAGDRDLAPRSFDVPETSDWRKLTIIFNSLGNEKVLVYVGIWGGQSGKFWVDDWTIEEVGPINVLRRPGTPVTIKSEDGSVTYEEGRDYAPLVDPDFSFWNVDRPAPPLKLLPGSRIRDGQRLRVSWYHPMVIYESQVTVCMAEPSLYDIYEHEAKLLWEHLKFDRVILSMDEVRMGGTCAACQGRDMAKLLGECVTRQVQILRKINPKVQVYVWSDMFDPNHNARANYYLVQGDFTGSWKYIPKDTIIAVWGGAPRAESLNFFAREGFRTLIACYYEAPNLDEAKEWHNLAQKTKGVTGFMYTTWERKYELVGAFGDLLWGR